MSTDPRTLDRIVRRVAFARAVRCSVKTMQCHTMVGTGESFLAKTPCDGPPLYATVRRGRVSPRCEMHAYEDARTMGVTVDENMAIEFRGRRDMPDIQRAKRPPVYDEGNPLNGIGCLTSRRASAPEPKP